MPMAAALCGGCNSPANWRKGLVMDHSYTTHTELVPSICCTLCWSVQLDVIKLLIRSGEEVRCAIPPSTAHALATRPC
jgi:hypothetical protein